MWAWSKFLEYVVYWPFVEVLTAKSLSNNIFLVSEACRKKKHIYLALLICRLLFKHCTIQICNLLSAASKLIISRSSEVQIHATYPLGRCQYLFWIYVWIFGFRILSITQYWRTSFKLCDQHFAKGSLLSCCLFFCSWATNCPTLWTSAWLSKLWRFFLVSYLIEVQEHIDWIVYKQSTKLCNNFLQICSNKKSKLTTNLGFLAFLTQKKGVVDCNV